MRDELKPLYIATMHIKLISSRKIYRPSTETQKAALILKKKNDKNRDFVRNKNTYYTMRDRFHQEAALYLRRISFEHRLRFLNHFRR